MMDEQLKANVTSSALWLRLVFMFFFGICLQISRFILWPVVVLQFLFCLITGNDNKNLRSFGSSLSQYIYQICKFLSFNTEEKPFPFTDWPEAEDQVIEGEVEVANDDSTQESLTEKNV